ncbi:Rho-binding antiterminator [Vibrio nereis]|uniref:Transcriptional regulator n=1 Tax=Vibrio nereis TaxID=693 RepID=A0A0M0HUJ5_VIBNE|nr:Rho-binding antiterminator [Vibrio nereis]KOO05532.1 transcriptional regulator [Vibrio nereis]
MISCNEYDYIEIACMYRFSIRLTLKSGKVIEGTAMDTARNQEKEECIKVDQGGTNVLVELNQLSVLEVIDDNPHFREVRFNP